MDEEDVLREWLDALYEEAESDGLEPEWHDDRMGFSMFCPHCRAAGKEDHRGHVRPQPVAVLPMFLMPGYLPLPAGEGDTATGPAG